MVFDFPNHLKLRRRDFLYFCKIRELRSHAADLEIPKSFKIKAFSKINNLNVLNVLNVFGKFEVFHEIKMFSILTDCSFRMPVPIRIR